MRICGKMGALLAVLLLVVTARPTMAQTQALSFTPESTATSGVDLGEAFLSVGFQFTPSEDLAVSALGYFDHMGDGFASNHMVGIFDGTSLVTSATIPAGTASRLNNGFRYVDIPAFRLTAGHKYTLAATTGLDRFAYTYSDLAFNSRITPESGGLYVGSEDPEMVEHPIYTFGYQNYSGPNFEFTTADASAVPEPASFVLFLPALVLASVMRRRRS